MRIRIRDAESFDPGSGMLKFGSGIRDKPPGFATLGDGVKKNIEGAVHPLKLGLTSCVCRFSDSIHKNCISKHE